MTPEMATSDRRACVFIGELNAVSALPGPAPQGREDRFSDELADLRTLAFAFIPPRLQLGFDLVWFCASGTAVILQPVALADIFHHFGLIDVFEGHEALEHARRFFDIRR